MAEAHLIGCFAPAVGLVSFTEAGLSVICQPDPFLGLSVTGPAGKPLLILEMQMCILLPAVFVLLRVCVHGESVLRGLKTANFSVSLA